MKQLLFVAVAMSLFNISARAQMPYTFSAYNQTYVPLDTGASIENPGMIWNFFTNFAIPLGFSFDFDSVNCSYFYSNEGTSVATDTTSSPHSGFLLTDASLDDRGYGGSVSKSPVRYKLSGTAGNRIFKAEFFNAGFDQEYVDSGSFKDSVNLQVWFYEDSNIVELRYGPSRITGTDYFSNGNTMVGFGRVFTANTGYLSLLQGNPASPTVVSIPVVNGTLTASPVTLSSFPPSGTVYRFTPTFDTATTTTTTAVEHIFSPENVLVYPTACSNNINVNYKNDGTAAYNIVSITGAQTNIKGSIISGLNSIDIGNLTSGMYLLQLQNSLGSKVYKFVKL